MPFRQNLLHAAGVEVLEMITMTELKRPEWVHCIGFSGVRVDGVKTWCGSKEKPFFQDAEHAALNGKNSGRFVACRECVAAISAALANGHDDPEYAE